MGEADCAAKAAFRTHPRAHGANRYVYAVISRRSRGLSIGINLNPDRVCNFACVYCQVDRRVPPAVRRVDLDQVEEELRALLEEVRSGAVFSRGRFAGVPSELAALRDIAFSGDGEPTACPRFLDCVRRVVAVKEELGLSGVRIVLMTDAACLHHSRVREALELLDAHEGEIWAKLDAGTEPYYRRVCRSSVPFARVLCNITGAAQIRPLVIQSLFARIDGAGPPPGEIGAYCERLREMVAAGGRIERVQVYTVARPPAEAWVSALPDREVTAIAARIVEETGLPAEPFYAA